MCVCCVCGCGCVCRVWARVVCVCAHIDGAARLFAACEKRRKKRCKGGGGGGPQKRPAGAPQKKQQHHKSPSARSANLSLNGVRGKGGGGGWRSGRLCVCIQQKGSLIALRGRCMRFFCWVCRRRAFLWRFVLVAGLVCQNKPQKQGTFSFRSRSLSLPRKMPAAKKKAGRGRRAERRG